MKKKCLFLSIFVCLVIALSSLTLFGCTPLYERSPIKLNGKSYSSLASAIKDSKDGDTINIYQDIKENASNTDIASVLSYAVIDGTTYVRYVIDKPISIVGITQNGHTPVIHGAIAIDLTEESEAGVTVTLKNFELINDYVSLEYDAPNAPFNCALKCENGSLSVEKLTIRANRTDISNETLEQNNITPLSAITISRKEGTALDGVEFNYDFHTTRAQGYNNFYKNLTGFGIKFENFGSKTGQLEPFSINYIRSANNTSFDETLQMFQRDAKNSFIDCASDIIVTKDENKFSYLKTKLASLVKDSSFDENSALYYSGETFGTDENQTINVFGKMTFSCPVNNVTFVLKNEKASVSYVAYESTGTTVQYYTPAEN